MRAILSLMRPCPWCGVAISVPPALPDEALAKVFEARCGGCRGGVLARAPWRAFLAFVIVYGAVSNLLLWCLFRCWQEWQAGAGDAATRTGWAAVAVGGFVVVSWLAQRYLVGASELLRGKPPRGDGGGW